ncbi:hypothetical protein CKO45_05210 [Paracraurococcus ruber]|uniref:Polysaccharide biosynthesis protein n=1 Tax=Paracraurococcus ruber TaxID=77675 RepID=A0ABS1CT33_9PROT|nr:hypothetical protein [Paracraurococcus ruber]
MLAESIAAACFSLLSMLVIGRVIGPHAAGTGTVAIAAFLIAELVVGSLFPDSLVRLAKLEQRHADSAATAAVLFGILGGAVVAALGPLLAREAGEPVIIWLALALAPLLPMAAFSGTASGLYVRDQRFRLLSGRLLLGQPVALAVGLGLAWTGHGPWAMIGAQAVSTLVTFLLMLRGGLGLRPRLDRAALADLWPIALPQIAAAVVQAGKYRLFLLALSILVVPGVLAVAHFAFRLVDAAVAVVWQTVSRISMARLCALQHDREALAERYGELAELQSMLALPICLGLGLVAPDMVALLLGPAWAGLGEAARIVACGAALTFLYGDTHSLFVALGKARRNLEIAAVTLALPLAALAIVRPHTAEGAALAWVLPSLALPPVLTILVLREIGRSPAWLARKVAPGVFAGLVMAAAVLLARDNLAAPPWATLLAEIAAGGVAWLLAAALAMRGRLPQALRTDRAPVAWRRREASRRGLREAGAGQGPG